MSFQVTDHAVPVAWKGGTPFGILAECTNSDLVCLMSAFMKGNLIMDDMLQLRQMMGEFGSMYVVCDSSFSTVNSLTPGDVTVILK